MSSSGAADGLGLGPMWRRPPGASRAGVGRRRLSVARSQHERRREAFPVDGVIRLEPDQQLMTG